MTQIIYDDVPERGAADKLVSMHNALLNDVKAIIAAAGTSLAAVAAVVPTSDSILLKR